MYKDPLAEQRALNNLYEVAAGGGRPPATKAEQVAAAQAVATIAKNETDAVMAQARLRETVVIEHRKLDIEQQKVEVQKAEVIVKMLAVAVQGGLSGEKLLETIASVSGKLLPGAVPQNLALPGPTPQGQSVPAISGPIKTYP